MNDQTTIFLCYDDSSRRDVRVNLLRTKSGSRHVELWEEPDGPFQRGFTRETIPEAEFHRRTINGKTIATLITEHEKA